MEYTIVFFRFNYGVYSIKMTILIVKEQVALTTIPIIEWKQRMKQQYNA